MSQESTQLENLVGMRWTDETGVQLTLVKYTRESPPQFPLRLFYPNPDSDVDDLNVIDSEHLWNCTEIDWSPGIVVVRAQDAPLQSNEYGEICP